MKHLFTALIFVLSGNLFAQGTYPDIRLLDKINASEPKKSDSFFRFASKSAAPYSLGVPIGILSYGYAQNDAGIIRDGWRASGAILLNTLLTSGFKFGLKRERPYRTHGDLILKKTHSGPYSFPSGHSSSAFAAATSLSLAFPKWYVITPSYLLAGTIAFSRMHLGVHYPSDIWGGILIGIGSSLIVWGIDRLGN